MQMSFLQNLSYGRNEETLDLYLPQGKKGDKNIPVVVFVSGGAWSMKNKEMYGLLCSELANKLQAVVCCPNYSAYPKVIKSSLHVLYGLLQ